MWTGRKGENIARGEQDIPIIPHELATETDCCGCLIVQVRGDQADIICNECGAVIRTVPVERAAAVLLAMVLARALVW